MKNAQQWALACSLGALVSVGTIIPAVPAYAEEPTTPVEQCAAEAKSRDIGAWVCAGGTLYYSDGTGPGDSTEQDSTNSEPSDSTQSPAPEDATVDATMEVIVPENPTTEYIYTDDPEYDASDDAVSDGESFAGDDWDTWCESIHSADSTCSRVINDYVAEVKRNMMFGRGMYELGHFDLVMRTNLNGRQAQWRVGIIHDWGATMTNVNAKITCKEEGNPFLCGVHTAAENVSVGTNRWDSGTIYGNRLVNSNYYSGTILASFTAPGDSTLFQTEALSQRFNCLGTLDDRCRI